MWLGPSQALERRFSMARNIGVHLPNVRHHVPDVLEKTTGHGDYNSAQASNSANDQTCRKARRTMESRVSLALQSSSSGKAERTSAYNELLEEHCVGPKSSGGMLYSATHFLLLSVNRFTSTMNSKLFHILQFAAVMSLLAPGLAAAPVAEHHVPVDFSNTSLSAPAPRLGSIFNMTEGAKMKKSLGRDTSKRATNKTMMPEVDGLAVSDKQSTDFDGQTDRPMNSSAGNSQTALRRLSATENRCCYPVMTSCCRDPLLLSSAAIRKQNSDSMIDAQARRLNQWKAKSAAGKSMVSLPVLAARSVQIHRKPQKSSVTG